MTVDEAKRRTGDRVVAICAGAAGGQALTLGLVDEVAMAVVPVVSGSGKGYFGSVDGRHLLEDPEVVIQDDRVPHLRYRVGRRHRTAIRSRWNPSTMGVVPIRALPLSPACNVEFEPHTGAGTGEAPTPSRGRRIPDPEGRRA